ncbi:hypothetical protein MTR72_15790 [Bradyrhizobium sp. ISRA442]|uniref:hypothetical protein n=1 Tax=Bradyrhizobium sp. ISRA442 TaxID=2866197 RepID=UPI00311ABA58
MIASKISVSQWHDAIADPCWNNGNAQFLRGYTRELHSLGHEVVVFERRQESVERHA